MSSANFTVLFYRSGLLVDKFNGRGSGYVLVTSCARICTADLICSRDLDPMTFIYEFYLYFLLEMQRMCKYELPTWRFSKVIVWQTDRQTDIRWKQKLNSTQQQHRLLVYSSVTKNANKTRWHETKQLKDAAICIDNVSEATTGSWATAQPTTSNRREAPTCKPATISTLRTLTCYRRRPLSDWKLRRNSTVPSVVRLFVYYWYRHDNESVVVVCRCRYLTSVSVFGILPLYTIFGITRPQQCVWAAFMCT